MKRSYTKDGGKEETGRIFNTDYSYQAHRDASQF